MCLISCLDERTTLRLLLLYRSHIVVVSCYALIPFDLKLNGVQSIELLRVRIFLMLTMH